jgi:hypothetical protein
LQLTRTLSLAQLDPIAFQNFVETGVLRFATRMDLFDRDFPGQYARMIKQVRVSLIALIPPDQGMRATLANPGISRVITRDESGTFQSVVVQRDPQLTALSSPSNASGVFNLADSQSNLLLPFEDLGVDTSWEFAMPMGANPFDYTSIADVQLSIDYTALDSPDYRRQVLQQLDRGVSADRAYSFRQQFPDQWYQLNNPDQFSPQLAVQLHTVRGDFPPNLDLVTLQQVVLCFTRSAGVTDEVAVTSLRFTPDGGGRIGQSIAAGGATSTDGVISTRRGSGSSWRDALLGLNPPLGPTGQWDLTLASDRPTLDLFKNGQIQDILLVVTYAGILPAWPT